MSEVEFKAPVLDAASTELVYRTFLDFKSHADFLSFPLIFNRAKGVYYYDREEKRYFDGLGGIYVAILGHGNTKVIDALKKQAEIQTFCPPLHAISDITLQFVKRLGELAPGNLKYVKPFSGGSESIESALKFVRQYHKQTGNPGKYKIISRYLAYHGSTYGAMAASGTGKRKSKFEPHAPGFIKVMSPISLREDFPDWALCCRFSARQLEATIVMEDPSTVAAFIVEPIGNTGGIITPTKEYFEIIRDICTRYNVTLIFDEVITGFAKTGFMFASQAFGVTPDIICAGKSLSSGAFPLGAMLARLDMAAAFNGNPESEREFAHGNTFAGNPLAAAVGLAVLDEIAEKRLDLEAQRKGTYLRAKLESLRTYGVVREVRGMGMLLGVELQKPQKIGEPIEGYPELGIALKRTALQRGLIMRIDPTWFAVSPALTATYAELDELCSLIEASLQDAIAKCKQVAKL